MVGVLCTMTFLTPESGALAGMRNNSRRKRREREKEEREEREGRERERKI